MSSFSKNLKYLRKEYNLSQKEIADMIGIKQRMYSNYETGKSTPNLNMLVSLARIFRVSLDYLAGFGGHQ